MATIVTNEWTSVRDGYPIAGRVVLVIVERMLKSGNIEFYHDTAIWNGMYWIDERTMTRKSLDLGEGITKWYLFDKYFPNGDD